MIIAGALLLYAILAEIWPLIWNMAEICEICMKPLEHWIDGTINYGEVILCSKCKEIVAELEFNGSDKSTEECMEIVRKKQKRK